MWDVPKWMYLIIIIPFLVIGMGIILYGYTSTPETLAADEIPSKEILYFGGVLFMIMPVISALGVRFFYKRINDREVNLMQNGLKGEAEILSADQTGMYLNELPQIKFLLEITSPYGETYQMEHKDVVNMLDLSSIKVGAKLPVFIDPNNERNILLVYG